MSHCRADEQVAEIPLISCIIPCYNAAPYIERAVRSLCQQTYHNVEVICIDDGSKDDTYMLLQELASQDSRVKVWQQSNQGVSVARNEGVAHAMGEFLMFCDADDWYNQEAVQQLVAKQQQTQAEIVVASSNFVKENGTYIPRNLFDQLPEIVSEEAIMLHVNMSSCAKLFSHQLITTQELAYLPSLKVNEEYTFVLPALLLANKVAVVKENIYNYYLNPNSASQSAERMNFDDFDSALTYLVSQIAGKVAPPLIEFKVVESILYGKLLNLAKLGKITEIKQTVAETEMNYPNWLDNPYLTALGKPQRLFLFCVKHRLYRMFIVLAKLHAVLTG